MIDDALSVLARAGAPIGPPRRAPETMPSDAALRRAVFEAVTRIAPAEQAPYVAWLGAMEHHWPTRFGAIFGEPGEVLLRELRSALPDRDRYLKLRRIAIENLAHVL